MTHLLELDNYDSIQSEFSSKLLWDLFDGNKDYMNLAHECLDRHSGKGRAISVKHDSGDIEHLDYDELITSTSQFAHQLEKSGIKYGERVAISWNQGRRFILRFSAQLSGEQSRFQCLHCLVQTPSP